jgi:hypothetical protein
MTRGKAHSVLNLNDLLNDLALLPDVFVKIMPLSIHKPVEGRKTTPFSECVGLAPIRAMQFGHRSAKFEPFSNFLPIQVELREPVAICAWASIRHVQ